MKTIVIAFTLKNQDEHLIAGGIKKIYEKVGACIVLSGHLPTVLVNRKKFDNFISNQLDLYFPMRLCLNDGVQVFRKELAAMAMKLDAEVYVIGEIRDGVKEEIDLYTEAGLPVHEIPLV